MKQETNSSMMLNVLDCLGVGCVELSHELEVLSKNELINEWFDIAPTELIGAHITNLFEAHNIPQPLATMQKFKPNTRPFTDILTYIKNQGDISWSLFITPDGGKNSAKAILIGRDMSDQQMTEEKIKELSIQLNARVAEIHQIHRSLASVNRAVTGEKLMHEVAAKKYITNVKTFLERIIAHMPCYVFWKNTNFEYLGCSEQAAKIVGLNFPEDIVGKTDYDFGWDEKLVDDYRKVDTMILKTGQPVVNHEEIVKTPDSSMAHMLVNKVPLFSEDGTIIGIAGISVDITDRKKMEAELNAAKQKAEILNQVKSEFISNMSHDIRTPLAGIVGLAKELRREVVSDRAKQDVDDLVASSDALLSLLSEILEIAQIESGHLEVKIKKFSLKLLLEKIHNLMGPTIKQNSLEFNITFDDEIPTEIYTDPSRLHRILLNILSNSLKFTEKGSIDLRVKTAKKTERRAVIVFEIEDTGIGIAKEKQDIIFSPFTRVMPSHRGIYSGSGLGLSIVKKFCNDIHAEILIESEPGKGTLFRVLVPVKVPILCDQDLDELGNNSETKKFIKAQKQKADLQRKKEESVDKTVLLVEDNRIAQRAAEYILTDINCSVEAADNAETAFKKACNKRYDYIFMDIGLPDQSGCELTKDIRSDTKSLNQETPIIALTAHVMMEKSQECLDAGMQNVLLKPLTVESAIEALSAFHN